MAERYTRRINLYINGKEVRNDISSIKKEMYKLQNEQARMTLGSKEYVAQGKKIRALKGIIQKHNADLRSTQRNWFSLKNAAESFNKYFAIVTAGVASFTGLFLGMKKAITVSNDFEERLSNLSALTGQTGESLEWLGNQAKELSTKTLDGGIRITKSAQDIVDAFTKMGSARPELLKDKNALVEVTKQALILSEAAKIELQPAIDAVAAAMNQFNLPATESERIINAIAAGSLAGSAEVADITESLANAGTVAAESNLTLEQTVGIFETLAERQLKGAEAGTQLRSTLLSFKAAGLGYQSGIFNLRDAVGELKARMDAQNTALEKDNVLIDVFGKRNITVGTILVNSIDRLDEFTKAVTNTDTAIQQATTNTDNNNAKLAQAKNRIATVSIELGKKLAPAYAGVISKSSLMLKGLIAVVDIFKKHGGLIITTGASITAYTIAVKLATLWQNRFNTSSLASIVTQKLQALAFNAQFAAIALYNSAVALLSGKLKVAAIQFRAFSAALSANPIGIVAGGIIALGAVLFQYNKKLNQVSETQKALNDVEITAQQNIAEQKVKMEQLLRVAQNEGLSINRRKQAISELNKLSPEYLGNLTLETINTDAAKNSTDQYIQSLLTKARVQAAENALIELEKERIKTVQEGTAYQTKWYQTLWNGVKGYGNATAFAANQAATGAKNAASAEEQYINKKEALIGLIGKETEKKIEQENAINGSGKGILDFESQKKRYDKSFKEEQIILKQQFLQKKITQIEYDNQMYILEQAHLIAMRELYRQHGEDLSKIDEQIIDKKIDFQKKLEDMQGKSDEISLSLLADDQKMFQEINDQMDEYLQKYEDNLNKKTIASQKAFEIEREISDARKELVNIQINAVGQLANSLSSMFEQGSAAQIAMIAIEKAIAIAQIWINLAKEKSLINVAAAEMATIPIVGPGLAATYSATMTAKALAAAKINTGLVIAQTVASAVSSGKREKTPAHAEGGFTNGERMYIAGEAGTEFIAPNWMVRQMAPVFANLEAIRQQRTTVNKTAIPQFASGGYSSNTGSAANFTQPYLTVADAKDLITANNKDMIETIKNLQIFASIEDIESGRKNFLKMKQTSGL